MKKMQHKPSEIGGQKSHVISAMIWFPMIGVFDSCQDSPSSKTCARS